MILGLTLLYVGAVLFVNGIWLLGKISDKEVSVINILVGSLNFLIALYLIFHDPGNASSISAGAFTILFAFTYLWVGANQFLKADGSGLGWFCLFVSITAAIVGINSISSLSADFDLWNTFNWFAWSLLWFCFFALLALSKSIQKQVAFYSIFCAIFTGWIPGVMILQNMMTV